jgi:hypothetical protein
MSRLLRAALWAVSRRIREISCFSAKGKHESYAASVIAASHYGGELTPRSL